MNVVGLDLWQAAATASASLPRLLIINTITALFLAGFAFEGRRKWRLSVVFVVASTAVQFVTRIVWP